VAKKPTLNVHPGERVGKTVPPYKTPARPQQSCGQSGKKKKESKGKDGCTPLRFAVERSPQRQACPTKRTKPKKKVGGRKTEAGCQRLSGQNVRRSFRGRSTTKKGEQHRGAPRRLPRALTEASQMSVKTDPIGCLGGNKEGGKKSPAPRSTRTTNMRKPVAAGLLQTTKLGIKNGSGQGKTHIVRIKRLRKNTRLEKRCRERQSPPRHWC